MGLQKLLKIELGLAENLALADVHVVERVDAVAGAHDVVSDGFRDELADELAQVRLGGLLGHDLDHLLADGADVSALGVRGLGDLLVAALGEANAEKAEDVAVGGLDVAPGLNEGVPLLDERAELVAGEVHTVEVGEEVETLDFFADELDLTEREGLVLVEVSKVGLEDAADESIGGGFCTSKTQTRTPKGKRTRTKQNNE